MPPPPGRHGWILSAETTIELIPSPPTEVLADADGVRTHRPSLKRRPQLARTRRGSFDLLLNPGPLGRTWWCPGPSMVSLQPRASSERPRSILSNLRLPAAPSKREWADVACGTHKLSTPHTSSKHCHSACFSSSKSWIIRPIISALRVPLSPLCLNVTARGVRKACGPIGAFNSPPVHSPGPGAVALVIPWGNVRQPLHDKLRHVMTGLRNAAGPPGRQSEGPQLSAALARSVCELTST